MLSEIQNDEFGPGSISFNKIIPMPPDLDIESGSRTQEGLRIYMDFMDVYSLSHPLSKEEQLNVDERTEALFLRIRSDIDNEVWELGKKAYQNIVRYGAQDWYDWRNEHWGTKWDAGGYEENTDYSQCDKLAFRTSWGEPAPVIQKLSEKYPDIQIIHQWSEEQMVQSCGKAKYLAGKQIEIKLVQGYDQMMDFSVDVWRQLEHNGTPIDQGQTMQ